MVISMVILFLGAGASPVWSPQPIAQCENVFQLSESVYSGGEPQGEAAWSALAERGIKTIVSVDSARPDVEAAKRHGLRYIHLPIGYDGFSRERALQFGRVLTDIDGPVYFHCHHGKHRGPAAVAAGMAASGQWTPETATAFLKAAGTSAQYTGLYRAIREFEPVEAAEFASVTTDFPEIAALPPYQERMAVLDRRKDNLSLAEAAGWTTPPDHPDLSPPHEALQLREIITELIRLESGEARSADYRALMRQALEASVALEKALRAGSGEGATAAFGALSASCTACHKVYRN
jgi:protein tyrosine phosphatase (PTP) superfamily phosphohydrolase (DUF442 family)